MSPTSMHVRHHYRYEYSAPVHDVRQKLVMVPPDRHGDQMLTSFDLDVRGTSGRLLVNWDTDRFGNRLCLVEAERVEEALDFEAWFTVHRRASAHWLDLDPDTREVLTRFTPLTLPDWRIRAAATRIAQETQLAGDRVHRAHEWTASSIRYQPGVTGTQTPAAMALYLGQGVCQDYAHIMLSLLRALGIACRYVSGHLLGDGAPHAWVEALLVDSAARLEVVACDPTHSRAAGSDYIVVATGRDFSDVTSTSGVFTGAAVGKLHWSKQASGAPEAVDSAA